MNYKSHIDGLRAFAVVPVVAFHLSSTLVPGGYVGVDIFFVISGFLITSILYEDMTNQRYSLMEFYKRRILRILPALLVLFFFVAVLSKIILLPSEQEDVGSSLIAASAFVSNIFFWNDSGYFTTAAETKPLLHTWSLAVEEQFYIAFPPLLFVIFKYCRKHVLKIIAGLSILSFIGCVVLSFKSQPSAFYLLPARAWELGIGAGLAVAGRTIGLPKRWDNFLAPVGLLLIISPLFLLHKNSLFPGWNAVYPCLGAMLIIGWADGNWVGRFLSLSPFVKLGRISYSLYLWHWPLIVFWKKATGNELEVIEILLLGVLSVCAAIISTRYVEKPFRAANFRLISSPKVVSAGGLSILVLVFVGALVSTQSFQLREYPSNVIKIANALNYRESQDYARQFRTGVCLIGQDDGNFEVFDRNICTKVKPAVINVLLFGDSHAAQYWGALREQFPQINVMQATSSGCRPLLMSPGEERCTRLRDWVFEDFLRNNEIDLVILGGRWSSQDIQYVSHTLETLKSLVPDVLFIGPTVEYSDSLPLLLARSAWQGNEFSFDEFLVTERVEVNDAMRSESKFRKVEYMDVLSSECEGGKCLLLASDGLPMQFDYGHLTLAGAREVIRRHLSQLERLIL